MPPTTDVFASILTRKGPTTKAIQKVLRAIGEATSGTKNVLQTRLLTKMVQRKMPILAENGLKKVTRVLSIDMGIRNLAYCVAEVKKSSSVNSAAEMSIASWHRLDLSEAFREYSQGDDRKGLVGEAALGVGEDEDSFKPETLSHMAYWFLNRMIDQHQPDVVLIERQRWRSASSPTIQQWTLRVNTLEAIMWGILTTLKSQQSSEKTKFNGWIRAVDPKRVGHFWLDNTTPTTTVVRKRMRSDSRSKLRSVEIAGDEESLDVDGIETVKRLSRSKAEKKAKIQLLRSWLDSDTPSTSLSNLNNNGPALDFCPIINFFFSPVHGADTTRQAFLYATDSPTERSKRTVSSEVYEKKVDDITDCFLQVAAWVAWDLNLTSLEPQIGSLQESLEDRLGERFSESQLRLPDAVNRIQTTSRNDTKEEEMVKLARKTTRKSKASTARSLGEDEANSIEETKV